MKRRLLHTDEENDPMSVVSNLFDVSMVFAVALMVALVTRFNMTEIFSQEDFTVVKNPGKENMEIITKEGQKIERYTPSEDQSGKQGTKGRKVGVAYELDNGDMQNNQESSAGVCGDCLGLLRGWGWSGRRGSNPRLSAWEADALPLSYYRIFVVCAYKGSTFCGILQVFRVFFVFLGVQNLMPRVAMSC